MPRNISLVLVGLLLFSSRLVAQDSYLDPQGVSGMLVIADQQCPRESCEQFVEWSGGKEARIVLLTAIRSADEHATTLVHNLVTEALKSESRQLTVLRVEAEADWTERDTAALAEATGIWIAADDDHVAELMQRATLVSACQSLLERSGVVATSGPAGRWLGSVLLDGDPELEPWKVIPEAALTIGTAVSDATSSDSATENADQVDSVADLQNDDAAVVDRQTEYLIRYAIAPESALLVRGRLLRAIGAGVSAHLPATATDNNNVIALDQQPVADLTALRRIVRDRLGPPFPPVMRRTPEVPQGTLIIIGGGGIPEGLMERFVELAGGEQASIVILPTAMPDPISERAGMAGAFRKAGAGKVTVLAGRTRDVVESPEYLQALAEATGIWFGGGRQWRFVDAYLGTKAETLMHEVLNRGGVIAGSSAGASIQAEYMARGNPLGNLDIMAAGYERGLGFLPGAAVDQHFTQRRRQADMLSLVTRYPQVLGIGIDETTAIVVQERQAEVVGKNQVYFYDLGRRGLDQDPPYEVLSAGETYQLAQ